MIGLITAGVTFISKAIGGIFGYKKSKVDVIKEAIKVLAATEMTKAQQSQALGLMMAAEANSDGWLTRSYRPLIALGCCSLIVSFWFGYVPPHLLDENVPPMIEMLIDAIMVILTAGIVTRTVDKAGARNQLNKLVKGFTK